MGAKFKSVTRLWSAPVVTWPRPIFDCIRKLSVLVSYCSGVCGKSHMEGFFLIISFFFFCRLWKENRFEIYCCWHTGPGWRTTALHAFTLSHIFNFLSAPAYAAYDCLMCEFSLQLLCALSVGLNPQTKTTSFDTIKPAACVCVCLCMYAQYVWTLAPLLRSIS